MADANGTLRDLRKITSRVLTENEGMGGPHDGMETALAVSQLFRDLDKQLRAGAVPDDWAIRRGTGR